MEGKEPQVAAELEALKRLAEELSDLVTGVYERLKPVLMPAEEGLDKKGGVPTKITCPMAVILQEENQKLAIVRAGLRDILNRLEL